MRSIALPGRCEATITQMDVGRISTAYIERP